MTEWKLIIHTCNVDGTQPDEAVGHDWTISRGDTAFFYEGQDNLNLGEARQLTELLNKAGYCDPAEGWNKASVSDTLDGDDKGA